MGAGGLRLPTSVGLSETDKDTLALRWNTIDGVESKLEDLGLVPDEKPSYPRPVITGEQLTTAINQNYTSLYAQHLAWFSYMAPILARVKARLLGYTNELTNIETRIRKDLRMKNRALPRDERLNEKDIETEIWTDPRFLEVKLEEQRNEQFKVELVAYLEIVEHNLRVISRQVEIRKIEINGGRTENNLPGRGKMIRTP